VTQDCVGFSNLAWTQIKLQGLHPLSVNISIV